MDYSVRTGDRGVLIETLRQFAADRGERGESERATEARRAAQLLEDGEPVVYFERVLYTIGDPDRYSVVTGSREEIAKELMDAVEGWNHQDRVDLAVQAAQGRVRVHKRGAEFARVGHLLYVVRD